MATHGSMQRGENPPKSTYYEQGRFGRMFPSLEPFAADTPTLRAALMTIGKQGGIMDAQDDPGASAKDLIVNPALSVNNPNNPTMTAGMTFLGQFVDHDITLDTTSSLEQQVDPEAIQNFRTPTLALDNIYGLGHRTARICTTGTIRSSCWSSPIPGQARSRAVARSASICRATAREFP